MSDQHTQGQARLKTLLVDDEEEFLNTMVKRLRKRNLEVSTANQGRQAIEKVSGEPFDVVVLDMAMPGMSGIDTLREIKKVRPSTEVIILTGHAEVEAAVQGMELGAFDYLLKPADIDELLYKIQDAFTRKQRRDEAEASRKRFIPES
jgi:DNA-binding NtrC family response regulator